MIHHARQIPGSKSIVDIHNAGHRWRRNSALRAGRTRCRRTRLYPMLVGTAITGAVGETADDAGESAFHPRNGDNYTGIHNRIHVGQQAVQARNPTS